jgi:hypothetical protein
MMFPSILYISTTKPNRIKLLDRVIKEEEKHE